MNANTQAHNTPVLKLERTFNATPERLWSYWTDPTKYAKWLNPAGIDLVVHEWDARPGGKVHFDMPQPDGNRNPQHGVFHVLRPYTEIVTGEPDKSFLITVRFTRLDAGQTKCTVEVQGLPSEWHSPATVGWNKGFDQLAGLLAAAGPDPATASAAIVGRSVRLERFYRASPARVYGAWTTPFILEKFFWPSGRGKVVEFDLRPGGRLVMAHETQPWKATWEYTDVVPNERLVFHDLWDDGSGHKATGTMTFLPEAGGTRLVVTHGPFPEKGPYRLEDAVGGFRAVSDNLEKLLESNEAGVSGFTIERTFKAAPEKVWKMWTTPEGLMRWWALSAKDMGFDFTVKSLDVREGGTFAFGMKNQQHDLVNRGTYRVVRPHRTLSWTWHFDIYLKPHEKPYDVSISVELTPTATGGTKMVFTQGPLATPEHTDGSRQGVLKNFEKLAAALGE